MSARHLAAGHVLPTRRKGVLRVYSMIFCPYAQRARLVLAHKEIKHETVNCDLVAKAPWLLSRNPAGRVPILEMDDNKIIPESLVCMEFLDETYPGPKLTTSDPYAKAMGKLLSMKFTDVIRKIQKLVRAPQEEKQNLLDALTNKMADFEKSMPTTKFLTGDTVALADYAVWPWVERFPAMKVTTGLDFLQPDISPKLSSWYLAMLETPGVKGTIISTEDHLEFLSKYVTGKPDYDLLYRKSKL